MNGPSDVYVDDEDNLWVTDASNHRVLRFDGITNKSSGAAADGVLGQNDFVTSSSGTNVSKMTSPQGLCVSSAGTLFVGTANRVVRFNNAAALGNGAGASAVLGQASFTGTTVGCSATSLDTPYGVCLTPGDSLWVCDVQNNRCLRYDNASSIPTGSPARGVVGQPDFTSKSFSSITSRSLLSPYFDLFVDAGGNLWVPDYFSHRVIRFPQDLTKPTLSVVKPPKSVTKAKLKIRGTAADFYGISGVYYKIGNKPAKLASGKTKWSFNAALAKGKNKIAIWAVDSVGNTSIQKRYTVTRK
jgi:streptogramin lyase